MVCKCHGVPMTRTAGNGKPNTPVWYWRCRIKHNEWQRAYRKAHPVPRGWKSEANRLAQVERARIMGLNNKGRKHPNKLPRAKS